jgi:hypothetical protein
VVGRDLKESRCRRLEEKEKQEEEQEDYMEQE